jgi:ParB-like chromosome segregation protein Spo0J
MAKKGKKKNDTTPQITTAKVNDLLPYANNAREHTDEQVAQVAASIQEFGWTNPIITHGQTVVAGHARLAAARKLNLKEVPVIDRSDMSEAQWKAYVLADNQLAQNATWNEGRLTLELDTLADLDFDLDLLGFDELELHDLMTDAEFSISDEEQGELDTPSDSVVTCPDCGHEFNAKL